MKNRDSASSYSRPGSGGSFSRTLRRSVLCGVLVFLGKLWVSWFIRASTFEIELEMSATTGDLAEFYYAAPGEPISHARTVRFRISTRNREYRVRLPSDTLSILRFDPGSDSGSVLIRRMTVREGSRELKLIDGPRVARVEGMKGIQREAARRREAVEFTATESDPYIVFAIPPGLTPLRPWQRALLWGLLSAIVFALADLVVTARLRHRPALARRLKAPLATVHERLKHPAWSWLSLALPPVAGLLWARGHLLPTVTCLSLTLALASTALAGVVAQSWIEGLRAATAQPGRRPGLIQVLWLGQYLIFALAMLITPVAGVFADLTGIHVPYRISLPLLVLVLGLATLRVASVRKVSLAWPTAASAPPAALALLAVFRALQMHSVHASSIGHDTGQHIYWTQHVVDYGYLPLAARGTDLLDDYPRFFHVLAGGWASLGLSTIVGPFVKAMPALQTTLACAFLCELLPAMLDGRATNPVRDRPLMRATLGAFVAWHMTFGDGQQIYDGNDLSGTPRLSAAWVLLGLPLLFLAHHAGTLRGVIPWIVGLVPVLAVVGLGVNPVLLPLFLTYSLPVTILLAVFARERGTSGLPPGWWRHFAAGGLVAVLLLFSNSFVWNKLSGKPAVAALIGRMGLRTVVAGLPDPSSTSTPTVCETPLADCLFELAKVAVVDGGQELVSSIQSADMAAFGTGNYGFVYWLLFSAPLFVVALRRVLSPGAASQPSRHGARTFLVILAASAVPAAFYPVVRALIHKLASYGSAFYLLDAYYGSLRMFLGAWVRCLIPLSSWLLLPTSLRGRMTVIGWLVTATAGVVGLNNFQVGALVSHRDAGFPWTVDWPELRAIRRINDFVPPHESVIVPAWHVDHGRENLLMSIGPTAIAATELKTKTLFAIRLGTSLDYGWRDLKERFCAGAEARGSFLRSVNARWVLVRAESPSAEAHLDSNFWNCGVTLRTLEAEYPPAWTERDLALYRINP